MKSDRARQSCPWCHRPLGTVRSFAVKMQQESAVNWIMKNKSFWIGKPLHGSWRDRKRRPSDAWRIIGMGLKAAGIYSRTNGLRDMRITELVAEGRRRRR